MALAWLLCCLGTVAAAPPPALAPFLKQHCSECHDATAKEGGLDLATLGADLSDAAVLAKWERLHDRVRDGEMPPKGVALPVEEKARFLKSLAAGLTNGHARYKGTVIRRLNRFEYERTLNALLGTHVPVAELFPEDGKAFGFDNVGEALDLSPVQLQRYLDAAGLALDAAVHFGPQPPPKSFELRFDTGRNEKNIGEHWLRREDGAVVFFLEGGFPAIKVQEFRAPAAGRYNVRIHATAHRAETPLTYAVHFGRDSLEDPAELHSFHEAQPGEVRAEEFAAILEKDSTIRLYLHGLNPNVNNWINVNKKVDKFTGPGLAVLKIELEGPLVDEWPGRGHRLRFGDLSAEDKGPANQRDKSFYKPQWRLVTKEAAAELARLLPPFAAAAFRRPVAAETVQPFIDLGQAELAAGATLDQALRTAQIAVLSSPDFLYLLEPAGKLDDFALAARLSYMLWGLPPDAPLLALAAEGRLSQPAALRSQTERLLADPRAQQFTTNFVGQWLNLRDIDFTTPDKQLYPEYDGVLRYALLRETELFFEEVLKNNRSLLCFLDSDWTFLNERLARHYRIPGVQGLAMRKVALAPEHRRGGLLTHASVLKVSANGTTTSPVVRGAYVLERLLGVALPPPPPGVPGVEPDIRGATTLRQQLDKHRSLESCNACHKVIDPPGFALEHYDVMGGWRENYRSLGKDFPRPSAELTNGKNVAWRVGPPVDAAGQTPEGEAFQNLADYKRLLLARPQVFTRALAEKLAIYATGRGMGFSDRAELERIATATAAKEYGFRDLIHEVVQSAIFTHK